MKKKRIHAVYRLAYAWLFYARRACIKVSLSFISHWHLLVAFLLELQYAIRYRPSLPQARMRRDNH